MAGLEDFDGCGEVDIAAALLRFSHSRRWAFSADVRPRGAGVSVAASSSSSPFAFLVAAAGRLFIFSLLPSLLPSSGLRSFGLLFSSLFLVGLVPLAPFFFKIALSAFLAVAPRTPFAQVTFWPPRPAFGVCSAFSSFCFGSSSSSSCLLSCAAFALALAFAAALIALSRPLIARRLPLPLSLCLSLPLPRRVADAFAAAAFKAA